MLSAAMICVESLSPSSDTCIGKCVLSFIAEMKYEIGYYVDRENIYIDIISNPIKFSFGKRLICKSLHITCLSFYPFKCYGNSSKHTWIVAVSTSTWPRMYTDQSFKDCTINIVIEYYPRYNYILKFAKLSIIVNRSIKWK